LPLGYFISDPLDVLMEEHRMIEKVIGVMKHMVKKINAGLKPAGSLGLGAR